MNTKHLPLKEYNEIISKLIEQEIIDAKKIRDMSRLFSTNYFIKNSNYLLHCYSWGDKIIIQLGFYFFNGEVSLEEIIENVNEEMKKKILFNLDIFNSFL